ncbi:MAG: Ig-like domain-containing protein, partial [Anaerolineales bacterium]|nr:Ig-like domain-containing protein [Anaerolineales bacterium]
NIRNSTFYGNQVAIAPTVGGDNSQGGAIFMGGGTLNANFVSFANNRAQANQGADLHAAVGTVNLQHSVLVNPVNTAINCFSAAADTVNDTLVEGNSGVEACGAAASTAFADTLTFGNYGGPTQTLGFSTAIANLYNAASACTGSNNVDQRGTPRPQGVACDRGAFELINTPPTITTNGGGPIANINVAENTTAVTDVDATDTDLPAQTLTYSITGGADQARFFIVPATGVLTFAAAPNFETPADAGVNNIYDVTVQVADGLGGTDTQAIAVTVTHVNNAPSFTAGADQTVNEDAGAQTVNGWATGLDDGETTLTQGLTFIVTNNTNPGLFSAAPAIDAAGNLTYTPAANANGSATITIVLRDDGGTANGGVDTSAPQTFVINVTPVQDPPFFTSAPVTNGTQDALYIYNITVTDPDGDPITITGSTVPAWLTFTPTGVGTAMLSGTPTNADVGPHTVVLRATDGIIAVPVEQAFTITVTDLNDAPTFTSAPVTTAGESTLYTYNVITADLDAGDTLTISATTLPAWLTLVDHGNRTATLSGTPN